VSDTRISKARPLVAKSLEALSQSGLDLMAAIASGKPITDDQAALVKIALKAAGEPNAAAVEFPFLRSIRLLAAAAADPGRRATMPPGEWKRSIEAAAQPPKSSATP